MRARPAILTLLCLMPGSFAASQSTPPLEPASDRTPNFETEPPPDRVMPADPVVLRRGAVTAGSPTMFVDWEGTRYLFADESNRTAFRSDPQAYAAKDGGACGRMGPLGGLGDARRYAIEGGDLYFFASDACMERFRREPARYVEPRDRLPSGTPEQQAAGRAAIDRWVSWSGSRDAVERAARYSQISTQDVIASGKRWSMTENIQVDGPLTMRRAISWRPAGDAAAEPVGSMIETTSDSAILIDDRARPSTLVASRRAAFERQINRLPYCILRARFRPEAGLLAIKSGEGPINGTPCDFVRVWFEGTATNLAIDQSTGELVQMGYVGRDGEARVGTITMNVLRSGGPEALRLPVQWATFHEGQTQTEPGPEISIRIEGPQATTSPEAPTMVPAARAPATGP